MISCTCVIGYKKADFHIHNNKANFSPPNNSFTHKLTIQAGIGAENYKQATFDMVCF